MADDVNPALRTELLAAQAILTPQIRGLHDLTSVSIGPDLLAEINKQIVVRETRRNLIDAVLASLDGVLVARKALEADGYPQLTKTTVSTSLFTELKEETSDITAAVGVFEEVPPASRMAVVFGEPEAKPV